MPTGLFLNKNWELMTLLRFSTFLFFIQKRKKAEDKKGWGKYHLYLCFHFSWLPVFVSFSCFSSLVLAISVKKGKE